MRRNRALICFMIIEFQTLEIVYCIFALYDLGLGAPNVLGSYN